MSLGFIEVNIYFYRIMGFRGKILSRAGCERGLQLTIIQRDLLFIKVEARVIDSA